MSGLNAPPADTHIFLDENEKKLAYALDTKIPDAGTFTIVKEDHTLGNLVRMQLLRDERVIFAGYRMPHPLELVMHIKIRTRPQISPVVALSDAVQNLVAEMTTLEQEFRQAVQSHRQQGDAAMV